MKKLLVLLLSLLSLIALAKEASADASIYDIIQAKGKEIRSQVTESYEEGYDFSLKIKTSDYKITYKVVNPNLIDHFEVVGFRFEEVDYIFETKAELIAAINSFSGIVKGVISRQGVRNFSLFCEPIFQKDCLIDRVYPTNYYNVDSFYTPFSLLRKDGYEYRASFEPEIPTSKVR